MNDDHSIDQDGTTPEKPPQVFGTGALSSTPEVPPEGRTQTKKSQSEVETPPPAKKRRFKLPSLNLSVRARLFITFMSIAPLVLWIGLINLSALTSVADSFEDVLHESVPQLETLGEIRAEANKLQAEALSFALGGEAEELEEFEEAAAKIPDLITQYASVAEEEGEAEETDYAEEMSAALVSINEHATALIALKQSGAALSEMDETLEDLEVAEDNMETIVGQAIADEDEELEAKDQAAEQLASTSRTNNIASMGAIFVFALVLGFIAARNVSNPIKKLQETTLRFSEGDRTARSDIQSRDEFGVLATNFNQMAAQLQGTLEGLEDTVEERTKELRERATEMEASQRVAFAASERTTPDDFLNLLVNLILDQFDVYHAQVYLVDDAGENAVLRESTGYAGRQLLGRGHQIPLSDAALVTTCINSGQSVLVSDVTKDPNHLPNPLLPHTQSELVVPLKLEDRVIGALDIQDRVANRFRDDSVVVFETMAEQVAFLFENNELLDQINQRTSELEKFTTQLRQSATVANQLGAILNPEQLLNEAVVLMQSRFSLYHVHVYLVDQASNQLIVEAGSGQVGLVLKERGHSIPLDHEHSVVARAAREVQPSLVVDVSKETDHLPNPLLPDTRAELAVPLVAAGQVIGVLDMQDETPGRFTEADADTFMTLGSQIATSLETARLFAEQQKTQQVVKEGEDRFRALSEASLEGLIIHHDGIIVEANQAMADMVGRATPQELIGENAIEVLVHPEYHEMVVEKLRTKYQGTYQVMGVRKDGTAFPAELESREMVYQGRDARVVAVRDVTAREEAEKALQFQNTLLKTQQEATLDGILVVDQEGKTISYNQRFMEMWAIPEESMQSESGKPALDLVLEKLSNPQKFSELMNYLVEHRDEKKREEVHLQDGSTYDGYSAPMVGSDETLYGRVWYFRDITGRKEAEDSIIQGDRLKSEFLANMSHELRTPLNSIIGYTDVLLMGLDGELEEEKRLDVLAIQQNSGELLRIINDILDLAKIEAGRMIFELSEIDVKSLLQDVQKSNAGLLVNKPVEVQIEVEEDLPAITADEGRLTQVMNNLVSNAVKFTEEGTVTLKAARTDGYVQVSVEDTGVGISEKDLQVIFEQFRQADGSIARPEEGTGLGLAITRSLVDLHGGIIDVQSELGKGSTFSVKLPVEARISADVIIANRSKTNGSSHEQTSTVLEKQAETNGNKEVTDLSS
ncbi:MAG: PAS domain S-box protein [Chloroflexi bacterium]|nr:MAG: PAS domain S-box protein [Chloroflexota bacterium]MBL1194144.1 PAS domain S-box protein [Chloroflexota bacterium]NOH11437.1 GAF domain-containing protein [Chloroflexota bacterium]